MVPDALAGSGSTGTETMPAFDFPPVEEVAIGAHFRVLDSLKTVQLGDLAHTWSRDYPSVEEWAPLPPIPDELSPSSFAQPPFQIDTSGRGPMPACGS